MSRRIESLTRYIIEENNPYANTFLMEGQHYELLAYLSEQVNNITIYDIGSATGQSALALSFNKTNKIISYDIVDLCKVENPGNIEFVIGNFFEDENLLKSPLIIFDVDPHNGIIEKEFYKWVKDNNYKGTILFDDINLNQPMKEFWSSIEEEKHDISSYGHWSGTGLVVFK